MRLVNAADEKAPFGIGKCKNNIPPQHILKDGKIPEGNKTKEVTINGDKATLIMSDRSTKYVYIQKGEDWLYADKAEMMTSDQTAFVDVPKAEKPVKEAKEKGEKTPKAPKGDTAESVGLDLNAKYDVYGTVMTGQEAKKRFGLKNIKDGLASGKVVAVGAEGEATAAAEAGDTGAA